MKKKPVSVKKKPLQWRKKPLFFSFTVYTQFFMAIHSNFFSLIFPSFSLTFLPFFAVGALVIYAKIPRKLKKAICSFFFLFFWSAQMFSYCSWPFYPSLGMKQLALEAFWNVSQPSAARHFKIGFSSQLCPPSWREKRSLTVRKFFLTPKREKNRTKYY